MKQDPLKNLRIASPCPMNWTEMTGDERVRFCSSCNLHVYNIAELTRKQAAKLITETEGRICGRIYRRGDGTVITKDCPVGLRAIRRRLARGAGAVFATIVALSTSVFGQKPTKKDDPAGLPEVTISRKISDEKVGTLTGTVVDAYGAMVVGARITVFDPKSGKSLEVTSTDQGFRLEVPDAGVYDVFVESPGFVKLELTKLSIAEKESVTVTMVLTVWQVLTGVVELPLMPVKPGPTGISTQISIEQMRKLPLP
jgi:hypothetical protein